MSPRIAQHRRVICSSCPKPCQLFKDGHVHHDDPATACEDRRFDAFYGEGGATPPEYPSPISLRYDGSAKWAELHEKALCDAITPEWLATWASNLPVFGCGCKGHWLADMAANQLPATGQFLWSVARHNTVNRRLQRPFLTDAEALQRWRKAA